MSKGSAVSATELLQIVFVVLKLCGVIDWEWHIILLPMLIHLLIMVGTLVFACSINRQKKLRAEDGAERK